MTAPPQREIVIELERVQVIRKRAKTTLITCPGCRTATDAITLDEAARLFETTRDQLLKFVQTRECHHDLTADGRTLLCVPSLIEHLHHENQTRRPNTTHRT